MLLCIDIGNSNIKFGLFNGKNMVNRWRVATNRTSLAEEYAVLIINLFESEGYKISEVTGCAISSVVPPLTQEFIDLSKRYFKLDPIIFNSQIDIDMKINTDYPAEVGHDLIMNALAAREMYGAPVVVISFGTATSFVAVSKAGDLEGVAIAPGILTSTDSLFRTASALPRVALEHPKVAIGKNTIESMRSGIVYGFVGLVENIVNKIKSELGGTPTVVATGGLATMIFPETKVINHIEPNLALIGLRIMVEKSRN